jgi:hypothetical protein
MQMGEDSTEEIDSSGIVTSGLSTANDPSPQFTIQNSLFISHSQ